MVNCLFEAAATAENRPYMLKTFNFTAFLSRQRSRAVCSKRLDNIAKVASFQEDLRQVAENWQQFSCNSKPVVRRA